MRFRLSLGLLPCLLLASTAPSALAQGRLEDAIKKPKPTRQELATIEAEVAQRVKKLSEAVGDSARLQDAKERLTKPAKSKDASPAGLAALTQACAKELSSLVADEDLDLGMASVLILRELDDVGSAEALAAALRSSHASVRIMAARSIHLLHKKLKGKKEECETVISALGLAGAAEKNPFALRRIYEAIKIDPGTELADRIADALIQVLASRVRQLAQGSRDEQIDVEGVEAAAACYARAGATQRVGLMRNLSALLAAAVNHYFEPDIGSEQLPRIAKTIAGIEQAMTAMARESKATPPSVKIADITKTRASDRAKQEKQAREALAAWLKVLKGEPWKIE
jgi:hypothetical protein